MSDTKFRTRGIFWELSNPERREIYAPLYTIKVEEDHGLPSAYKIYMSSTDEYEAAIKLAGNMKNWRTLCDSTWFMNGWKEFGHEGLVKWRLDMEARDKSLAKIQLQSKAEEGNVAAMTKLYNMSQPKLDNRLKKKMGKVTPSKVTDIQERMRGK